MHPLRKDFTAFTYRLCHVCTVAENTLHNVFTHCDTTLSRRQPFHAIVYAKGTITVCQEKQNHTGNIQNKKVLKIRQIKSFAVDTKHAYGQCVKESYPTYQWLIHRL